MGKKRIIQKTDLSGGNLVSSAVKIDLPKKKLSEGEAHIQSTYNNYNNNQFMTTSIAIIQK